MESRREHRPDRRSSDLAYRSDELGSRDRTTDEAIDIERIESVLAHRFTGMHLRIDRIPAGLGHRRFYRIGLGPNATSNLPNDVNIVPESLIARVEPTPTPGKNDPSDPFVWLPEPSLEPIRTILEEAGLPVPRCYAHDLGLGIDLLEDLGARTLLDVGGSHLRERYREAVALIPRLQDIKGNAETAPAFERALDADLIRTKAAKVLNWSWPGLLGREASVDERVAIESGFVAIAELLADAPRRLAHRDFKAENLHLTKRTDAREELVMIDVQGAFMAPPEYDLVCLLRDLQVELPEDLVEEARESRLADLRDASDRRASNQRFEAISVVRLAKDVAHIVNAAVSGGDRRRWHEIPRGLELLERSAGRLAHTFEPAKSLSFVIHVLSRGAQTSDIDISR